MPSGELELIGRSSPVLSEVAAEMSEIFDRAGVRPPAPGLRRAAAVSVLRPDRGNGQTMTLLIAAVAGLVGLAAGAFVIRTPATPSRPEVAAAVQPKPQPQVKPPIALAEAAPEPTPAEAAPVRKHAAPKTSFAPAKAAARWHAPTRSRFADARLAQVGAASAKPPIRLREPMPMAQPVSCEQDAGGDGCRRAVIQADRHLRAVYESAIRRGVSRATLVDYRDRWTDLRERDTDDPSRLIESYGALAYDLGREAADGQDDAPRPRGRSGLNALADLLLPWR